MVFSECSLVIGLALLFLLRFLDMLSSRDRVWKKRVNIHSAAFSRDAGEGKPATWWVLPGSVLLGRRPWEEKLTGENIWVRGSRGFSTFSMVLLLILYGAYMAIILPFREMAMVPVVEFRGTIGQGVVTVPARWSIIIRSRMDSIDFEALINATSVQVERWKATEMQIPPPVCLPTLSTMRQNGDVGKIEFSFQTDWYNELATFYCDLPPEYELSECVKLWEGDTHQRTIFASDPVGDYVMMDTSQAYTYMQQPDLHLRIDFTGLSPSTQDPVNGAGWFNDALLVYVGMTEDVDKVLTHSRPTYLIQGSHILTIVEPTIRQYISNTVLGTFGYEKYDSFLVLRVLQTSTIPAQIIGADANNPNISTMYITRGILRPEDTVYQDTRAKSVVSGLSALGGLGSLFSTILAIFFGANLARSITGTKPLSAFGLFHELESEKGKIVEESERRYPRLRSDIAANKQNPGVLAYIFDNLIDIDQLGFGMEGRDTIPGSRKTPDSSTDNEGDEEAGRGGTAVVADDFKQPLIS
ncbi:hypothetical protein DFP72DRAFT_83118 [Ephemerocybe angulata]|uniref:Uncharacterized protein n=1 Tax=Ephemerocybe angulata TaxID=980116 RepID=A0A8H6LW62_9AGAR|nr:hypothetical protein DFP72DRAFT_83118 [Tulosesus angulatus]